MLCCFCYFIHGIKCTIKMETRIKFKFSKSKGTTGNRFELHSGRNSHSIYTKYCGTPKYTNNFKAKPNAIAAPSHPCKRQVNSLPLINHNKKEYYASDRLRSCHNYPSIKITIVQLSIMQRQA